MKNETKEILLSYLKTYEGELEFDAQEKKWPGSWTAQRLDWTREIICLVEHGLKRKKEFTSHREAGVLPETLRSKFAQEYNIPEDHVLVNLSYKVPVLHYGQPETDVWRIIILEEA